MKGWYRYMCMVSELAWKFVSRHDHALERRLRTGLKSYIIILNELQIENVWIDWLLCQQLVNMYYVPMLPCKREGFMCLITKVNKIQTKFCKVCLNCGCKNGWEAMILTSNKVGNAFGHVATRIRVLGHVLGLHDYFHALNWSKYGDTRNKKSRNFSSKEPVRINGLALTWGGLG